MSDSGAPVMLASLKAALAGTVKDGALTLGEGLPELDGVRLSWRVYLNTPQIELSGVSLSGVNADGPVTVRGTASLLGTTAPLEITFFLPPGAADDDGVECFLATEGSVPQWSPAAAYLAPPPTDGSSEGAAVALLRQLTLAGARLAFTTRDLAPAGGASDLPTLPDWLAATGMQAGLSFQASFALPDALAQLTEPLVGKLDALAVVGTVAWQGEGRVLDLGGSFGKELAFPGLGLSAPLSLSATGLRVRCAVDGWVRVIPAVVLELSASGGGRELDLELEIDTSGEGAAVRGTFAAGKEPSLEWAQEQLGLGSLPPLQLDLGALTLRGFEGDFDLAARRMKRFSAGIATARPLSLFGGQVTVAPAVLLSVDLPPASAASASFEVWGTWMLGSTRFQTYIEPDTGEVVAQMAEGESLDMAGFLAGLLPGSLTTTLKVIDLELEGNRKNGTFTATLATSGEIGVSVEGSTLGVEDVAISLQYDGEISAQLRGTLEILGYLVRVDAEVGDPAQLSLVIPELPLSDLAELFLKATGEPVDLGEFALQDIGITLVHPGGHFDVSASIADRIAISPSWVIDSATFSASRDADGIRAAIRGEIEIAGQRITVAADWSKADGWHFRGADASGLTLSEIAGDLGGKLHITLPESIAHDITLCHLTLDYWSKSGRLKLGCTGNLEVQGHPLAIHVDIDTGTGQPLVSGTLKVDTQSFTLAFETGAGANKLQASWSGRATGSQILQGLGLAGLQLPSDLDPTLTTASFGWDGTAMTLDVTSDGLGEGMLATVMDDAGRAYVLALTIASDIELTSVPEIGLRLGDGESVRVDQLHLRLASKISSKGAKAINDLLPDKPDKAARLPAAGIAAGLALAVEATLAGEKKSLALPIPAAVPADGGGATPAPVPSAGLSKWFDVGRSFGPIEIRRLGFRYRDRVFSFLLDAGLATAIVELDLLGLAIGSPLEEFRPEVHLDGLQLAVQRGAFELAGFFENVAVQPPVEFEYAGGVVLEMEKYSLSGIGMYGRTGGDTSMFLFAELRAPIGGPPYFFVTGLLGGFGLNTDLRLPSVDELHDFPLIAGFADPGAAGGTGATPMAVMDKMLASDAGQAPWLTMQAGAYWAAAGLEFTSFGLIETHALLVCELGNDFKLRLLGRSVMQLPPTSSRPYVFAELDTEAEIDPAEGAVRVRSLLSPSSYVIDPSCRLTGGFAFYMWYAGDHEGDFVLTLGGYHPAFRPPAHYPQVPRLGYRWQVSDHVTITGESYFALTPSCAMAGTMLAIVFEDGDLSAWLIAHADMLIEWKPFHFEVSIGISVGVSCSIDLLFTSITITLEVGADLDLWGPPTGGEVTIHCWVVSFTIGFGHGHEDPELADTWARFVPLLPDPARILNTSVEGGLVRADDKTGAWTVRGDLFAFSTESVVPASELALHLPPGETTHTSGGKTDIRPMVRTGCASTHVLQVVRLGESETIVDLIDEGWRITPRTRNVAAALWSAPGSDALASDATLPDRLVGFSVQTPQPRLGGPVGPVAMNNLSFEDVADPGVAPDPSGAADLPIARVESDALATIAAGIAGTAADQRRRDILAAMKAAGYELSTKNDSMDRFKSSIGERFRVAPLIAA